MKVTINGKEVDINEEQAKNLGIDFTKEEEKREDIEVKENTKTDDTVDSKLEKLEKKQREMELREQINKTKEKYGFTEQVIREKILPTSMERNLSFDEVVAIKKSELSDTKSFNEFFGITEGAESKVDTTGGNKSDADFRADGFAKVLSHGAKIKNLEI